MRKLMNTLMIVILFLFGIFVMLVIFSALSNLGLPEVSPVLEKLSEGDKVRLAEMFNLRKVVGDAVWPGWGQADIPAIVYNESYAFLVGYPNPPAGWIKVPAGDEHGGPWEMVESSTFYGAPYYRQYLPNAAKTPEAFTVMVGERWVSSLQTRDWMTISLIKRIKMDLPGFLQPVFPYRLFARLLVKGDDQYISLLAHESFHAYQGMAAPQKLASSERANQQYEEIYPWYDTGLQADWQAELELLADALKSSDREVCVNLASRFLDARAARREQAGLRPELVSYEQQREWLEGLARYAELDAWRVGATWDYTPLPEVAELSDFSSYAKYASRWRHELDQMTRMADDQGDGRFYYSGMAVAKLLDMFMPDWKSRAFEPDVWLEDLLAEAITK